VIQVPFVVKPWQEICNACIRRYTPRGPCWMGNSNHVDKILIEWGGALSDGGANYHLESARPNTVSEIVILNKATKKNPRLAHWSRITRGGYGAGGEPGAAFFLQVSKDTLDHSPEFTMRYHSPALVMKSASKSPSSVSVFSSILRVQSRFVRTSQKAFKCLRIFLQRKSP
jgi:hypothetical protein